MTSLSDLARDRTTLDEHEILHLQRLARVWGLLADLSGADLLLLARAVAPPGRFVVLAHVRPTTATTAYTSDPIGRSFERAHRPTVAAAFDEGRMADGQVRLAATGDAKVSVRALPVRCAGKVVAVLSRDAAGEVEAGSELEGVYRRLFDRFAVMISAGEYPFPRDEHDQYKAPRVGDGLVILDEERRVDYASPNAISAFHRLGIHRHVVGRRFEELGFDEQVVRAAYSSSLPVTAEVERGSDTTVVMRCIPLLVEGTPTGAMIGFRDISELRRRDRMLLSKDATIREIHHRVKNNLQTISSLLRIQSRRMESSEAKDALEQSVRRIGSMALVHETLAQDPTDGDGTGDEVRFLDVVRPIVRLVEEGLSSPEKPIHFRVTGDVGVVSSEVAMPLSVVITELLQNAVDHAFGRGKRSGTVQVDLVSVATGVRVVVTDDGVGLPADFDIAGEVGLGLTIVQTFVVNEMGGSIAMRRGDGSGDRPGTVVELEVPLAGASRAPTVTRI
ncbi:MAG: histidine kinase N-terminal domain-containing protein [Acidimicrobiia bacterium]|nr:histidine kinase N-terminal domain-containing protein [Acidimicrobiia bacterium]